MILIPNLISGEQCVYCSCQRCGEQNFNEALRGYRFCKPCHKIVRDMITTQQLHTEMILKEYGLL